MGIKLKAEEYVKSAKRIATNSEQFIQAAALLIVAAYGYSRLKRDPTTPLVYWSVVVSLVVIGLRGTYELVKFLDKPAGRSK